MKKYILEIICSIVIILSLSFIVTLRFCNLDIKSSASQYDQDNVDIVDKVQIPLTDISILNNIEYYEGICSNDTTISARYVIRNIGNNPLVIQYVNPNCSCTKYTVSKQITAPGDTVSIVLHMNTSGKTGQNKVTATFKANTIQELYILRLVANLN